MHTPSPLVASCHEKRSLSFCDSSDSTRSNGLCEGEIQLWSLGAYIKIKKYINLEHEDKKYLGVKKELGFLRFEEDLVGTWGRCRENESA